MHVADRVTLACSCEAEVVVPVILMMPRHHVVTITAHGKRCHDVDHRRGNRIIVRWQPDGRHRVYQALNVS